ncbi:cold-regulated protein 27-like isoform X2 [Aristolochia californica]|uniref:cold-regulated protein 27-like isoform X2 n=1 Tax=Aristolochia californica TaxID=171875 RepID=UPI0035D888B4
MSSGAEISVVTEDNAEGVVGPKENVRVEHPIEESTCAEWTDEKHSLYLNFIEASFVNQLYNHKYGSMESLDWYPRGKEAKGPNCSQSSSTSCFSSGQFKVLRSGCWEKLNFEKTCSPRDARNETLLAQPWVQHYRPPSCVKAPEVASPHLQENRWLVKKHRITNCGVAKCSKLASKIDFVSIDTEVSDQNFTDENCCCEEQEQSKSRKKRVVPFGNSKAPENLLSRRKIDASCQ